MPLSATLRCPKAAAPAVSSAARRPVRQSQGTASRIQLAAFLPASGRPSVKYQPGKTSFVMKAASSENEPVKSKLEEVENETENAATNAVSDIRAATAGAVTDAVNDAADTVKGVADPGEAATRGSQVYGGLAVLFASAGLAKVAFPAACMEGIFSACGGGTTEAFMRLMGVFTVLPAAALWCLKGAAEHGRLGSETYQRLNASLMVYGIGYAVVAATAALQNSIATTTLIWAPVAIGAVTAMASAHVLAKQTGGLSAPLKEIPQAITQLFNPPSLLSLCYGLLAVACFGMGAALLAVPSSIHGFLFNETLGLGLGLGLGVVPVVQKRLIGVGLLAMGSSTALILKDAAERSRLGASTFKILNLAFVVTCFGTLATMAWYVKTYSAAQITAASGGMFGALALGGGMCAVQYMAKK
mmetsp:Transcript_21543/g.59881  ORF Transcript_21543/g.59881 Transcript_21543/m.59881 type:complete len:415 (-) Transcript_21543:333-1577(-)